MIINVNNQNIGNNLNINISMNVENMTFLKNNMTQKEELLTQFSRKELEKDCLLKMSSIIQNNKNLNDFTDGLKKINTYINNTLGKRKKRRSFSEKKTKHSSIKPITSLSKVSKDRNDSNNSNISSHKTNNLYKKSYTGKEKLLYNAFTNLTTTQENTFQLNSSYDNINKISNNKYIKDINLQSKIRQVLMKECSQSNNCLKKKNTFLKLPIKIFDNTPKPSHKSLKSFGSFINDIQAENNRSDSSKNKSAYREGIKTENNDDDNDNSTNKKSKRENLESSSKIIMKKNNKFSSCRNVIDLRKIKCQ